MSVNFIMSVHLNRWTLILMNGLSDAQDLQKMHAQFAVNLIMIADN